MLLVLVVVAAHTNKHKTSNPRANKLQWYLKPDPKDNESNVEDENVPDLDIPTLKSESECSGSAVGV